MKINIKISQQLHTLLVNFYAGVWTQEENSKTTFSEVLHLEELASVDA